MIQRSQVGLIPSEPHQQEEFLSKVIALLEK